MSCKHFDPPARPCIWCGAGTPKRKDPMPITFTIEIEVPTSGLANHLTLLLKDAGEDGLLCDMERLVAHRLDYPESGPSFLTDADNGEGVATIAVGPMRVQRNDSVFPGRPRLLRGTGEGERPGGGAA